MSEKEIDIHPVTHITTDAIGQPGKRVFYIQGWQNERTVTVIVEKIQIQSLAVGVEQFLAEIKEKFPELPDSSGDFVEEKMRIHPPVDPVFRVGEVGLGYDSENDLVVLVARELLPEGEDPEEAGVVRFWCTRSQLRALALWGFRLLHRDDLCARSVDSRWMQKGISVPRKMDTSINIKKDGK
jgi:uncharacterized repeat protein (TIGR03847 family)